MNQYMVEFDHRSDNGPRRVGPFGTKVEAELHVQRIAGRSGGFEAEWHVAPLCTPSEDS